MTSSINRKRTEQIKEKKLNIKIEELKKQNSEILLNQVNVMPEQKHQRKKLWLRKKL